MNSFQPVLGCWNPPQVFSYVLFSEIADRNFNLVSVEDGDAKDSFGKENSFRVMSECAVTEVWEKSLRFVKPPVDTKIVLYIAAEFSGAAPPSSTSRALAPLVVQP